MDQEPLLPLILSGPILRKVTGDEVNLWFATSQSVQLKPLFSLQADLATPLLMIIVQQTIKVSPRLYIHMLNCRPESGSLALDQLIYYDVGCETADGQIHHSLVTLILDLFYPGHRALHFFIPSQVSALLFGSCRNFHYPTPDALVVADNYLHQHWADLTKRPCVLLHAGDQVYVDDVAGPTLSAIHHLIRVLALPDEALPDPVIDHTEKLYTDPTIFYNRQSILPQVSYKSGKLSRFFAPFRRTFPVFSSVKAENHLISVAEMIGLYLLAWSPQGWLLTERQTNNLPEGLNKAQQAKFQRELMALRDFIAGLGQVQRLMAHIPNYMIFDDHDVTDDWNLTAQWEQNVYSNPFSKRIISNALLGYWLFQGWGNTPERFEPDFVALVEQVVSDPQPEPVTELENILLSYPYWHYEIDLDPAMIVLDTRTHRWRSERSVKNPSGLLDWERLTELESILMNKEASIIVSPAPIFGVKLIETIQWIFAFCGRELMVDAENWMAHPGSAKKLLRIFSRIDTPQEIVVLSGDVHYSFCFSAKHRFRDNATTIWQLTSSGIKNEFPLPLIWLFDRLERMLYFAASPINLFTKRRATEIEQMPLQQAKKQILISQSNIGLVEFEAQKLRHFKILLSGDKNGNKPEGEQQKSFL